MREIIILIVTGIAGGILSSLLGGAALVTFPTLLAIGLSPVSAAIANTVSLLPVSFTAAYYERSKLPKFDRALVKLMICMVAGSMMGSALLLATPVRVLELLVPLLLALATLLFARGRQVAKWVEGRAQGSGSGSPWGRTARAMIPVGMYGGYFGAGAGVLTLGVLSVGARGDYRVANAIKNLLTGTSVMMSMVIYASQDAVPWQPVLLLMVGGLAGSWIGVRISRIVPRDAMHIAIVAMGAILTVVYAGRYWLGWL
ncbi:MAG: sulfite exporter TauE/SafE family protein [Hyphomicrobiaceae bacterium]